MSNLSQDLPAKIIELEMALAYQQRLCEQLNEVVVDHSRQLLVMQRAVSALEGRVKDLKDQRKEQPLDPEQEKPPHY